MKKKVDKWQEPAPAKQHKVLPVPDMEPKKRRGGRRFRKMKERYGLTDMRKAANRSAYLQSLFMKAYTDRIRCPGCVCGPMAPVLLLICLDIFTVCLSICRYVVCAHAANTVAVTNSKI